MIVGLVGLGRMGQGIAERLINHGHTVVAFDPSPAARTSAQALGVQAVDDLVSVARLCRVMWLMVPAGDPVDACIAELSPALQKDDIMVDGGNSLFHDTIRRHNALASRGVHFLDCGTSGGLKGRQIGFSLMIGGDKAAYTKIVSVFEAIACTDGFAYFGPSGAGHYVKMVHNGVEYALLQAYAEGFHLLKDGHYPDLDLATVANVWAHGSVVRSWIVELSQEIFEQDQELENIAGSIGENKTGQWTLDEAQQQGVPVDLIERALAIRAWSRTTGGNYATKVVSLLRNKFGGHPVDKKGL